MLSIKNWNLKSWKISPCSYCKKRGSMLEENTKGVADWLYLIKRSVWVWTVEIISHLNRTIHRDGIIPGETQPTGIRREKIGGNKGRLWTYIILSSRRKQGPKGNSEIIRATALTTGPESVSLETSLPPPWRAMWAVCCHTEGAGYPQSHVEMLLPQSVQRAEHQP